MRARLWRGVSLCVAVLVASATLLAVPAGAVDENSGAPGPSGPSAGAPPGSENVGNPSGSSTTTTTTKPDKKKKNDLPPSTTTAPVTATEDPTPSAGPPELAKVGVVLPDDSLVAAMAELNLERARVELLSQRRLSLDQSIQQHELKLIRMRKERKHEQEQRLDRAVATYRGQSSGWRFGALVGHGLADERAIYLVAAADASARRQIKSLDRMTKTVERELKVERTDRASADTQLDAAVDRLNRLLDKLGSTNGSITTIDGEIVFVPTGPSTVALLADSADQQLVRLIGSGALAATDGPWLAARHTLAFELARAKGGELQRNDIAAAIERDWDATPPSVLHAALFALRQVGKAYVYATAGPETFDCSGLTKAAYAQIRLGLPHFSGAQLHAGLPVAPDALRPGDLLTYGPDGSEHVTMYVGGGVVVEAKGRAYGVIVAPARTDPAKGFAGATRIVP